MSTSRTAIAATIAMITFALGAYGLHLRIKASQEVWQEEANSYRGPLQPRGIEHRASTGMVGQFRASRSFDRDYGNGNISRDSTYKGQPMGGGHPIDVGVIHEEPAEMVSDRTVHLADTQMPRDPRAA
jgi:hypothetical protein